jgi:hypothetical protein
LDGRRSHPDHHPLVVLHALTFQFLTLATQHPPIALSGSATAIGGVLVKLPMWLQLRSGKKSSATKSENLKDVRRQTDQRLQQNAEKEERAEKEN